MPSSGRRGGLQGASETLRKFDGACLEPAVPMSPKEIRESPRRECASLPVFARYLNASKNSD